MKMMNGLKHLSHEERLKETGLFSLEKAHGGCYLYVQIFDEYLPWYLFWEKSSKEIVENYNIWPKNILHSQSNYPQDCQPPDLEDGDEEQTETTIQEEAVIKVLRHLDTYKSVGLDGIHPRVSCSPQQQYKENKEYASSLAGRGSAPPGPALRSHWLAGAARRRRSTEGGGRRRRREAHPSRLHALSPPARAGSRCGAVRSGAERCGAVRSGMRPIVHPASCFSASFCPIGGSAGSGPRQPRWRHQLEASQRGEQPSAAAGRAPEKYIADYSCPVTVLEDHFLPNCFAGLSISSITNENENAKQQCKPTEVFSCENKDRNSKTSPFRSGCVFTKRSRDSSVVKLEIKLEDSDDECDLVIDVSPKAVNKKPRISRNWGKETTAVISPESLHDSAIADIFECAEEKSDTIITLRKNDKNLNKYEKRSNVSSKVNDIFLPDVNTDILKVLEERDALAYTEEKCVSSASSFEADMQKTILKQGNAKTNMLVEAYLQEHTANEDYVNSRRVTQSGLCTGHSTKGETAAERSYKEIVVNTQERQRMAEKGGNDNPEDTYPYPTYYLNKKESEITPLSSSTESAEEAELSGEDTELSESDDPLEECRRIFEEFEREAQKKDHDKQAHGGNVDLNLLETKVNVPGQKRRIAHAAKLDALTEEQSVYDRCGSKNTYLNFAVKTLKKLRDNGQLDKSRSSSYARSIKSEEDKAFTGGALYELLKYYLLTEEQLNENNFPRPNPEKNGSAILTGVVKNAGYDAFKRVCCRCGEVYAVTSSGEYRRKEECHYHSGRVLEQKVPGGMEKQYTCCERTVGSPGCQIAKLHVHDGRRKKLEGFMKTLMKSPPLDGNYGVYALDCETCYTTHGLESTRVTVVNAKLQVVYDTFVKPDGEVVDYDIRLSGATENDLKNTTTSLRDVQAILLNLFSADTILIGHSLEDVLFPLKLIHDTVVDTSVVFPHLLGLPHKRPLRSLMADYLRRIRQDDVGGHNSREDAIACMELMLWKVKEDNKSRKR
ncbi:uncharacterized protein VSU04_016341 [Chlamydotis macqueenii]